jgi:SAM-dependent methyltransferase
MRRRWRPQFWVTLDARREVSTPPTSAPALASGHACWRPMACVRLSPWSPMTTCAGKEWRPRPARTLSGTNGSAEATELPDACADLVSMASSFHWADFDRACDEFHRILRPGGVFVALWYPRFIEANPLLVEIDAHISQLKPDIRRVSSGRSCITERLTDMLSAKPQFSEVLSLEGRHSMRQTPEQYIGAWRSVNDLQVQLGPELFGKFLDFIEQRSGPHSDRDHLVTRAWAARRG